LAFLGLEWPDVCSMPMDWSKNSAREEPPGGQLSSATSDTSKSRNSGNLSNVFTSDSAFDVGRCSSPSAPWSYSLPPEFFNVNGTPPMNSPGATESLDNSLDVEFWSGSENRWTEQQPPSKTTELPTNSIDDTWVGKLAEINLKLYQHSTTLHLIHKSSAAFGKLANTSLRPGGEDADKVMGESEGFAIDNTFRLSRQLIDIFNEIKPLDQRSKPSREEPLPLANGELHETNGDNSHNERKAHFSHLTTTSASARIQMDPGTSMLVLSCYLRILEIYAELFGTIHSSFPDKDYLKGIRLPDLNLGTFSIHSNSSIQLILLLQLAQELLTRLGETVDLIDQPVETPESMIKGLDKSWHVSAIDGAGRASLQAIRIRETKILDGMKKLRQDLQKSGMA